MNRTINAILAALAIIVTFYVYGQCTYSRGRADAQARAVDARNDSVALALRAEYADSQKAFTRERDSTGQVIRALQHRAAPQTSPVATASGGTNSPAVAAVPDVRDSLIAALVAGRTQDSLQILFWKAQVAQRDSLIPQLQQARDAWRARSQRRLACVGGPSVAVGLNGRGAVGVGVTCGWRF